MLPAGETAPYVHGLQLELPDMDLNVSVSHSVQATPSGPEYPALQVQSVFSSLAAAEFMFPGQAWHVSDEAPTCVEYCAAAQLVHASGPVASLNVPAAHSTQIPLFDLDAPALQVHASLEGLASGELEFDGQSKHDSTEIAPREARNFPESQLLHTSGPVCVLYFPAWHFVQASPLGPVDPILHIQLVFRLLAGGPSESVGHLSHVSSDMAPTTSENFPAVQS